MANNNITHEDKKVRNLKNVITNLQGQINMSLYGTDRKSEVGNLDNLFQDIVSSELTSLTSTAGSTDGVSSFLGNLTSNQNKNMSIEAMLDTQFQGYGTSYSSLSGFIQQAYKNRKLQQADIHQVASQLIELSEAILITRDAMISPDAVEGRISRNLSIDNMDDESLDSVIPVIEAMENKFGIHQKIKNFIIPRVLEYGEYYSYIVPYSKIFNDFVRQRDNPNSWYRESADGLSATITSDKNLLTYVVESTDTAQPKTHNRSAVHGGDPKRSSKKDDTFFVDTYKMYIESSDIDADSAKKQMSQEDFTSGMKTLMSNITINNDPIPLPFITEGVNSMTEFDAEFVSESGDMFVTEKVSNISSPKTFNEVMSNVDGGVRIENSSKSSKKIKNEFKDIKDCYIKMLDPTVMIPIEIMNQTIGYYYVLSEDIVPSGGKLGSSIYMNPFEPGRSERTVIDAIAEQIVNSFDKKFLKDNIKFKETIVEAITYYNINEKKIKFQYIPVEYVVDFKVDQDENGKGQSMLAKSLFYAKLYLMLLLFKMMSIITNSNDVKVNYIRQSGIDKNIANKIQEIARVKQARRINMYDLFNYTTLINKVGNGSEMYVPTGRNNERGIETEILSGQDVQLNTELMEMLKNAYILGTGVPAAIINYLSEADFAKVVEQNNTKFNGRVVNYQLDVNDGCTRMYKKILKYSTNLSDDIIDNFKFVLPPPKSANNAIKNEAISNFGQIAEFFIGLFFPNDAQSAPENLDIINEFRRKLAEEFVPGIDLDMVKDLLKKSQMDAIEEKLKPKAKNGEGDDDIEDMGLDDMGI